MPCVVERVTLSLERQTNEKKCKLITRVRRKMEIEGEREREKGT